jgi:hypothetical protein
LRESLGSRAARSRHFGVDRSSANPEYSPAVGLLGCAATGRRGCTKHFSNELLALAEGAPFEA